jgi:hypothetical protein
VKVPRALVRLGERSEERRKGDLWKMAPSDSAKHQIQDSVLDGGGEEGDM